MIKRTMVTVSILLGFLSFVPLPAAAQSVNPVLQQPAATCAAGVAEFLLLRTWDACLQHDSFGVPQFTELNDIWLVALVLIEDGIKAAGYVAVGFVFWGGIKYIKGQGDPGQLREAREVIYNALFGFVLALLSVAIVQFVSGAITQRPPI